MHFWWPSEPAQAAAPVDVTIGGQVVDLGEDPNREAERLATRFMSGTLELVIDEAPITLSYEELGVSVDIDRLASTLNRAADPTSPVRRAHSRRRAGEVLDIPVPFQLDARGLRDRLVRLKDTVDQPAISARFDTSEHRLVNAQEGHTLDVWSSIDRIESQIRANGSGILPLAILRTAAPRESSELSTVEMHTTIGEFETRYNRANTAADRTHNVRTAGEKIDGLVLLPGEEFDFNAVVGERSEANGFRPAPVIAGGELTDGVGGGACQVAGTLHAAAYFAGLTIIERHPHSRPSGYIKLGLDAVVSYPNLNLRLRNDLEQPIVLQFSVEQGVVRAAVWGASREHDVSFVRRILESMPFQEVERQDESLPEGVRVLAQRGIPGFRVAQWRLIRDIRTNQTIRQSGQDVYQPTTQIWRLGTGPTAGESFVAPEGDSHPEYVADEYLTMTQGPEIEGIIEQRRAGRTGVYGWTARAGYPSAPGGPPR